MSMFSFFKKSDEKQLEETKVEKIDECRDHDDDSTDGEIFKFPSANYRVHMTDKSHPLLMQIIVNKDYLEEMSQKKLKENKNVQLTRITTYYDISALELFLKHHDPKHSSVNDERCSICLCEFFDDIDKLNINDIVEDLIPGKDDAIILLEKCDGHYFHLKCILNYISSQSGSHIKCPICTMIYGTLLGDQPAGTMRSSISNTVRCEGYNSCGTIIIEYNFPSGHLSNGKHYHGTSRVAYLPNNEEGKEVLNLLKVCFDRKLTFTVGTSVTTGRTDCVVWNGVHHKTSLTGGSSRFGYPDSTYLNRVKQELASKGITISK